VGHENRNSGMCERAIDDTIDLLSSQAGAAAPPATTLRNPNSYALGLAQWDAAKAPLHEREPVKPA
jgi:hypothetical protein